MRLIIDTAAGSLVQEENGDRREIGLYSPEAFRLLSRQWLNVGWDQKYSYGFSWLGVPIIQLPEDVMLIQEIIWRVRPDVIIETGVAHGGSAVLFASLCKCLDRGRVISIDVEIYPHHRKALEAHAMFPWITLIEGSSTSDETVRKVRDLIRPGETVLVVLDSDHHKSHVLKELDLYGPLVTRDSYLVVTDGYMESLCDVPGGNTGWRYDNPKAAAEDFAAVHPEFIMEDPEFTFNEGKIDFRITYWPSAFLKRIGED
ncbi:MAG: CmcI family methyltransferase [PVC group bacterium]